MNVHIRHNTPENNYINLMGMFTHTCTHTVSMGLYTFGWSRVEEPCIKIQPCPFPLPPSPGTNPTDFLLQKPSTSQDSLYKEDHK